MAFLALPLLFPFLSSPLSSIRITSISLYLVWFYTYVYTIGYIPGFTFENFLILLILYFLSFSHIILLCIIICLVILIIDFLFLKKSKESKLGKLKSFIGLIIGLFGFKYYYQMYSLNEDIFSYKTLTDTEFIFSLTHIALSKIFIIFFIFSILVLAFIQIKRKNRKLEVIFVFLSIWFYSLAFFSLPHTNKWLLEYLGPNLLVLKHEACDNFPLGELLLFSKKSKCILHVSHNFLGEDKDYIYINVGRKNCYKQRFNYSKTKN